MTNGIINHPLSWTAAGSFAHFELSELNSHRTAVVMSSTGFDPVIMVSKRALMSLFVHFLKIEIQFLKRRTVKLKR